MLGNEFQRVKAIMQEPEGKYNTKQMRTNPNDQSPNPAKRWLEWSGSEGNLRYYDKEIQKRVTVDLPFQFVLLDRLAVVRGWHDASESGIYSNEVRKTIDEPFTVRAFKMKEIIAHGFYAEIKDKIKAVGGKFNINLYIAFLDEGDEFSIGSLMLHGAPMSAWIEFEKAHRAELFRKGVKISSFEEGKKGGVTFRKPALELVEIPEETDDMAAEKQKELQAYLKKYLSRTRPEAAEAAKSEEPEDRTDHSEPEGEEPF